MFYRIADFVIEVNFSDSCINNTELIPSLAPFLIDGKECCDDVCVRLTVDDSL